MSMHDNSYKYYSSVVNSATDRSFHDISNPEHYMNTPLNRATDRSFHDKSNP